MGQKRWTELKSRSGFECQAKGDTGESGVQHNTSSRICWMSEKGELRIP